MLETPAGRCVSQTRSFSSMVHGYWHIIELCYVVWPDVGSEAAHDQR